MDLFYYSNFGNLIGFKTPATMWYSVDNQSPLLQRTQKPIEMGMIYTIFLLLTITTTMADAQISSTQPTVVNGVNGGAALAAAAASLNNCSSVKNLFEAQGISGVDVPNQPSTGKFTPSVIQPTSILYAFSIRSYLFRIYL